MTTATELPAGNVRVGDMIVHQVTIIGTDVTYVEAWEPTSFDAARGHAHSTLTHGLDGNDRSSWGKVHTRRLPDEIADMPLYANGDPHQGFCPRRMAQVDQHRFEAYAAAGAAILAAYPEAWQTPGGDWRLS